ncbi:putative selenoprotein [Arsenophonus endosymbiont of Aphis craccivora]|uniref:YbdD/YjiX family protein n=1 Tax=Arsenophonus endosymbiont of Aphis craccivora TaxID=1231049 RepID=UPI0015DCE595|nr:CstA-like transporter-associated (seleno)protein [Arsenophonus endosymbiont of Aphis craccivora]QLK87970.1 putative selenoprotein [Arsenophonus endosymbiont of Aphis craccivora]
MFNNLGQAGKYLGQAALMLIGIPDYDNYVQHMRNTHPEQSIMSYEEFFRQRQAERYASSDNGGFRRC